MSKIPEIPIIQTLEKLLQYNLEVQVINGPQMVPVQEFCNGFTVKNTGNSDLLIMGDTLTVGQSKSFGGNRGEIFMGRIDIRFTASTPPVVPRIDQAIVTQKFYTNIPRSVNNPSL